MANKARTDNSKKPGDAWGGATPEGVLDDEALMISLESGEASETSAAEWAQGRRKAAADAAGKNQYEQNSYDATGMYQGSSEPIPPPPPPRATPAPTPEPEPEADIDVDSGLFGSMFGRKKATPAPAAAPVAEADDEPEALAPVQPRAERAVFEPGGAPTTMEQRPLTEVRSTATRIRTPRRGGLFKKFMKLGIAGLVLVAGAGTAIYYGYHENLPVDQKTKDTMSKSVQVTKEKLDKQLQNLEELAERTRVKAEQSLDKAEKAMLETEQSLQEMGKGEAR